MTHGGKRASFPALPRSSAAVEAGRVRAGYAAHGLVGTGDGAAQGSDQAARGGRESQGGQAFRLGGLRRLWGRARGAGVGAVAHGWAAPMVKAWLTGGLLAMIFALIVAPKLVPLVVSPDRYYVLESVQVSDAVEGQSPHMIV